MPNQYTPPIPIADRFWPKADRSGDCWLWIAGIGTDGYGKFWIDGKTRHAHAVAYELTYGPLPPGYMACHNCPDGDNPLCVNPAHLFAGTHLDNSRDMVKKGRAATGDRHPSHLYPERVARGERHGSQTHPEALRRGSRHGMAKLTEAVVLDIRARAAAGERQSALAREYGVTPTTVSFVVKRKVWAHV